jgi:hypothetical protein
MGRRKTVRELQRQLQYAQARAAYTPPTRADEAATQRRPKLGVGYRSLYADNNPAYLIQVSSAGLRFFGGGSISLAAVGLVEAAGQPLAPRGFRPNMIYAMVSDSTPQIVRARASNRPYIRYARGRRGSSVQNTFSCAFQDPGATPTASGARTRFRTIADVVKDDVGGAYGRIWAEWERLPVSESGVAGV